MISAVPSVSYKVKTEWLKEGCVCVNVAADKNFEKDVRDKVRPWIPSIDAAPVSRAGIADMHSWCRHLYTSLRSAKSQF